MFELRYGIMNNGERYESNETKMRSFRHCFRTVMGIFHFISDEDWLYGKIYENIPNHNHSSLCLYGVSGPCTKSSTAPVTISIIPMTVNHFQGWRTTCSTHPPCAWGPLADTR